MNNGRNVRVSVVMILTVTDAGLPRRLESVLGQLGSEDELIIAACEGAAEVADYVTAHNVDAKIATARMSFPENLEAVLRQASGEYIFLAESCDTWHPGKLAACLEVLEQGAMAVIHDAVVVDGDLNELESSLLGHRFTHRPLLGLFRNQCIGCCVAFRRELLTVALPFPSCVPSPDRWLCAVAHRTGRVEFIGRALMFCCSHRTAAGRRRFFYAQRKRVGVWGLWLVGFLLNRRIRIIRDASHLEPK